VKKHTISLRFDGHEDVVESLKATYHVKHVPTLLLLNPDGSEIDRIIDLAGYREQFLNFLKGAYAGKNTYPGLLAAYKKNPDDIRVLYRLFKKNVQRGDLQGIMSLGRKILDRPNRSKNMHVEQPMHQGRRTIYEDTRYHIRTTLHRSGKLDILKFMNDFPEVKFSERAYRFVARAYSNQTEWKGAEAFFDNALRHFPESALLKKYFLDYEEHLKNMKKEY